MNASVIQKQQLFVKNLHAIKGELPWQNAMVKRMAALIYAQAGKPMDVAAIKRSHALIKESTGVFSTFRGNMSLTVAALLSLKPNPSSVLNETLKMYDMLKSVKFHASDYLVVAAYLIASQAETLDALNAVKRSRAFYDAMKKRRFFATGQDDYVFAAMLGLSDVDISEGAKRIDQPHTLLKTNLRNANSIQTLSQVLVLGGSCDDTAKRVLTLRDALKARKIKMYKTYTLPALGILALLPVDVPTLVRDIESTFNALRTQKGLGEWSVSTQELLLYTAAIVAGAYADNIQCGLVTAALSTSITNILIAQQAAMIAAVAASSAAAAAR
jgi:hypothetical protein